MKYAVIWTFLLLFSSAGFACSMTPLGYSQGAIKAVIDSLRLRSSRRVDSILSIQFMESNKIFVSYLYDQGQKTPKQVGRDTFTVGLSPSCQFSVK